MANTPPKTHASFQGILFDKEGPEGEALAAEISALKGTPIQLRRIHSIAEALSGLETKAVDFLLLNRDPGESLEFLDSIQEKVSWVPILVIQDNFDDRFALKAFQKGSQDVLVKGEWSHPPLDRVIGCAVQRKRFEEHLRHRSEKVKFSQRLEAVGKLAGGVAHDFNNLMMVVMGRAELLEMQMGSDSPYTHGLQEIRTASERAVSLTRKLLAFSRRQVLQPAVVNLNEAVDEFQKLLRSLLGENIELTLKLKRNLGLIKVDPGKLDEVLVTLAMNAHEAMPNGGELLIETDHAELEGEYLEQHLGARPGAYVLLAFSDNGVGMDAETRARIFEPFFSTKESKSGTGMSLASAYGIIKQSGGNIWVYSEPGKGSTFKVYLPRIDCKEKESGLYTAERTASTSSEQSILVVEDEEGIRGLLTEVLSSQGYRILQASNGKAALAMALESSDPIDLLITDVVMPGMGGKELSEQFKKLKPDTKILFMSGYTNNAIQMHGILDPGAQFLQKPFSPNQLAHKVRRILGKLTPK